MRGDSKSIFQDQLDAVEASSKNKGFDYLHKLMVSSFHDGKNIYKESYLQGLIEELDLVFSKPFTDIQKAKIKKEIEQVKTSETLKRIKCITDVISQWDIETVQEFKQTRLDPFNASLKTRIKPKTIKEVKGALLNNRVKNPVLC